MKINEEDINIPFQGKKATEGTSLAHEDKG